MSQVFTRLPPEAIAAALDGAVLRVGSEVASEIRTANPNPNPNPNHNPKPNPNPNQVASEIATHPQGRRQAWAPLLEALVRYLVITPMPKRAAARCAGARRDQG